MNTQTKYLLKEIGKAFDPLIELIANQMFWLLLWFSAVYFLMERFLSLGIILFLAGISRFYLACKEVYKKNGN